MKKKSTKRLFNTATGIFALAFVAAGLMSNSFVRTSDATPETMGQTPTPIMTPSPTPVPTPTNPSDPKPTATPTPDPIIPPTPSPVPTLKGR
ncbi:MAG TPA: hypothetical protein VK468_11765 [Pyrinomonadaceae bacterium]|nr:hypothetical protein [Pyrinomonadaceae bacterium]